MTLPPVAQHALEAFVVLNVVILMVTYVTLLERKFAARMQSRIGPDYVGRPHGWLQPIADALKLMIKEDIVPTAADRGVYNLAPVVFLVPCMLIFATIPFAPALGVADLGIGVLFFLAVSSLEIVGLFMGGWGSNNKYALLSAMRAVNQIISYDLPFVFAALVPVVLAGSLQMSVIVAAQQGLWFAFYPVIGQLAFLAYLVATLAAENRVPFDILEAESELVAGFRVEYSGMTFALIQLGEYAQRAYPDRFRGILALTYDPETGEENCIGCRLCEYICPPQVIKVEMLKAEKRNYAKTFTLELYACEFCELCVQVCPTDAIIMLKSFDLATADRRDLLLDKDRLHALGLQFEPSWATGNRLRDMQAPPKPARAEAKGEAKGETKEPAE